MNRLATERDILDAAIDIVGREVGLRLDIVERDVWKEGKHIDAIIEMPETGAQMVVVIKKWATHVNLGAVIDQIKNIAKPGHGLLVADYINPNMGERLKEVNIQFLDTAGNAYINQLPVYIYIKGNKPKPDVAAMGKIKTGKAFQPTGMKVIFAFLKDRSLINAPYREIAERAQVALGTVGWVISDLVAQGFFFEGVKKNQRELADFDRLLNKWVEVYPYRLKEKHKIGIFTTDNPDWWKTMNLEEFDALWGGEIAAAKYTNYLNPKHAVVYIKKANMAKFLQAARLRKIIQTEQSDIRIDLIEPFWKQEKSIEKEKDLAHPIVVYGDLIETADPRNLETANRLRAKYLH